MTAFNPKVGDYAQRFNKDYVKIIGKIPEGTIEFDKGYRVFDHTGKLYTEIGTDPFKNDSDLNLNWLVSEFFKDQLVETPHQHFSHLSNPILEFIPPHDERFHLVIRRTYMNKLGFLVKITKKDGEIYEDPSRFYTKVGKTNSSGDSVFDLVARVKM